ncbi:MAG: hypothetical protein IJT44_06855, partial [Clostridia bacterium]|nr:hypothetical protein [Clostridia bacterium]
AHAFSEETTPASCTAAGKTVYTCDVCGYSYEETIPQLEHDWSAWTSADENNHTRTCSVGGETETEAHAFSEETTPASCTAAGKTVYTCTVCGYSYEETIAQPEHDWSAWTKADEQNHTRTCSVGGETETAAHTFDEAVTPATCQAAGKTVYTCTDCGYSYEEPIAQLEHGFGDWKDNGENHKRECANCDAFEVEEHDFGEWVVTRKASAIDPGERERVCSVCGHKDTEPLPPLTLTAPDGTTGTMIAVKVPYSRRGKEALQLIASKEGVIYSSSKPKLLKVDENGKVTFQRLCVFCRSAVITATAPDGTTASCVVHIQLRWYHYILFLLFGCLWY